MLVVRVLAPPSRVPLDLPAPAQAPVERVAVGAAHILEGVHGMAVTALQVAAAAGHGGTKGLVIPLVAMMVATVAIRGGPSTTLQGAVVAATEVPVVMEQSVEAVPVAAATPAPTRVRQ